MFLRYLYLTFLVDLASDSSGLEVTAYAALPFCHYLYIERALIFHSTRFVGSIMIITCSFF